MMTTKAIFHRLVSDIVEYFLGRFSYFCFSVCSYSVLHYLGRGWVRRTAVSSVFDRVFVCVAIQSWPIMWRLQSHQWPSKFMQRLSTRSSASWSVCAFWIRELNWNFCSFISGIPVLFDSFIPFACYIVFPHSIGLTMLFRILRKWVWLENKYFYLWK